MAGISSPAKPPLGTQPDLIAQSPRGVAAMQAQTAPYEAREIFDTRSSPTVEPDLVSEFQLYRASNANGLCEAPPLDATEAARTSADAAARTHSAPPNGRLLTPTASMMPAALSGQHTVPVSAVHAGGTSTPNRLAPSSRAVSPGVRTVDSCGARESGR